MALSTALGALLFFAAAVMPPQTSLTNPMAEPKARFWTSAEYRIVPVRVHLMRDTITPAAGTTLSIADIARIFGKANGIWHAAGVELRIESVLEEKPAALGEYEHQGVLPIVALPALRPADTRPEGMFHVYYIGAMPPNGIFMRSVGIFVKESAELRKVPLNGVHPPRRRRAAKSTRAERMAVPDGPDKDSAAHDADDGGGAEGGGGETGAHAESRVPFSQ